MARMERHTAILPVVDIETLVSELRVAGVKFRNDIVESPASNQIFSLDPSGNLIEIYQPA